MLVKQESKLEIAHNLKSFLPHIVSPQRIREEVLTDSVFILNESSQGAGSNMHPLLSEFYTLA